MDFDRLQKVQQLAQQLLDQKICNDRSEATQQAEIMLSKDCELQNIKDQLEGKQKPNTESQQSNQSNSYEPTTEQLVRKLHIHAQDHAKILQQLQEEINSLKSDIRELKSRPVSQPVVEQSEQAQLRSEQLMQEQSAQIKTHQNTPPQQTQQQTIQSQQQNQIQEQTSKSHPKGGDTLESDVAIDKIFYCGPKN